MPSLRFFSKSLFLDRFISLLLDGFIIEEVDCNDDKKVDGDDVDDDDDDDDSVDNDDGNVVVMCCGL